VGVVLKGGLLASLVSVSRVRDVYENYY